MNALPISNMHRAVIVNDKWTASVNEKQIQTVLL